LPSMDSYSTDRNIVLILVDTLQNDIAEGLFRSRDNENFNGFTLFTNASGQYPFTTLSIPYIFSGLRYEPGMGVHDHLTRSDDVRMDSILAKHGWETSYLSLLDRGVYVAKAYETARNRKLLKDVSLYRFLPTAVKMLVFGDGYDFTGNTHVAGDNIDPHEALGFSSNTDVAILRKLTTDMHLGTSKPQFKWIHLWGAHPPARLDSECNTTLPQANLQSYKDQATCIIKLIDAYLAAMKESGVYDKSQIYILGDHGTKMFGIGGRNFDEENILHASAHPAILFKDFNASGPIAYSDAPVSLGDIKPTVLGERGHNLKNATYDNTGPRIFTDYPSAELTSKPTVPNITRFEIGRHVREPKDWQKLD